MPMPSSGIIVVEKPSTAPNSRITATNTSNSSQTNRHPHIHQHHTPHHNHQHPTPQLQQQQQQQQKQQQTHIQYYEYYDANENPQLSSQQQQQQHSTIVVDGSVFQNQAQSQQQQHQSMQIGGGRKLHTTTLSTSTSSPLSSSALTSTSLLSTTKPNLHIPAIKAGPMPQTTKQLQQQQHQQQQQIIQHTSHTTASATTSSNNSHSQQQQLQQHVQQVHLATTSTAQHQLHHHQQQPTQQHQAHMIQVSEEFLEQAQVQAQNHTTASNMMISATGEVIQQQQIFKIVSTDAATGNMIIDTSGANQNPNATTTSKVLLSNLTVLSKQQAGATAATIAAGSQQQSSGATAQTINFVNAKQLYAASSASIPASSAGVVAANLGKQQKFTVASANLGGSFKTAALKQTTNTQYVHQSAGSQQKINMTSGNRNMQMLTTARVQTAGNSMNHTGVISSGAATAQTMVLQQPHKFVTTNNVAAKSSLGPGGNVIKKTTGTLRMSNSNNTAAATKLMNSLHAQSTQGVKTFITQTTGSAQQQQQQNNPNQLSSIQQHHTKGGKSKFVKQYNNAILNSAGAVAIATLPHQQQQQQQQLHQNNINTSGQQQHQQQTLQAQSTYMNNHKTAVGTTTKINKINSKYATANVAAQLPPGTQLHQKTLTQAAAQPQQTPQQYQASNNSNIKFVNAQGTIIQQQQPLTPQKIHIKQHQTPYQSIQSFDPVDGNTNFSTQQHQQTTNAAGAVNSPTGGPANSAQLSDDIMMVNGTQMTDELSARILQSMSQKSFINQRYQQLQQQQHPVFQKSPTSNNSSNMLPPPQTANVTASAATQQTTPSHIQNTPNNHSNILLSPREYTLYPPVGSSQQQSSPSPQQPQIQTQTASSSPNHYSNTSSVTGGSPLMASTANYMANSMATITPHSSNVGAAIGGSGSGSSASSRLAQSAPNSRSQSMERKLHESSMSRKSTEYYKVNIKDYHQKCTFVAPATATIYATNSSPTAATSLIDFIIPLPSCTTITTTNTLIASAASAIPPSNTNTNTNIMSNCATMTTTITSFNNNNHNSNHNSLRGSHSNLATAQSAGAPQQQTGAPNIAASPSSSSLSSTLLSSSGASASTNPSSALMGSVMLGTTLPPRPPSIPPSAMMEPQTQVIHLQATKTLPGASNSSKDDDDIIGEEVRPVPVETHDIRLQILHAVLLDHTYANPMPLELPTTFAVQPPPPSQAHVANTAPGHMAVVGGATGSGGVTLQQQWSLGGIGAVTATTGTVANSAAAASLATTNYPMYSSQLSRLQQDDDAYSAISNSSRLNLGDIDPGEETETAPEAEAEDDSITRCICDLTHDDGYMICCDKCCAWQHVDCMGIDRQNIPEEYLCELCQPRPVDKARARALQVQKRKEQTQLMLAQAQAAAAAGTMGAAGSASGSGGANLANLSNDVLVVQQRLSGAVSGFGLSGTNPSDPAALQLLGTSGTNMKKGAKMLKKVKESIAGKKSKKADKMAAAGAGLTGKTARKETKKNTKRKKAGHDGGSTVGMTAAEKHAASLRQWIENYELAVTNHYSPELRARLHAITKQPSLLQSILNTENPGLKEYSTGSLENRATTVPHAGGKILISNLDISPNSPICELRGKYMLTTQYKTQNTAMNMNCPPPNNYQLASYKAHKTPGPFIFFYQLQGAEVTVNPGMAQTTSTTTLNPDGTYTTTTTTLPAQLSPPTYLRGPEICVDTRTYGNEARFVRRSCRPNAEIQHLFEKGTIHLFIVALTDIRASTEITIRHEPHDLLAVDNKKSNTMVIQPTSTPCACGLSKDCIFGPPLPQLPPAAKSNAGRKSLALNGGSSATGNLTAKQRKANQQNLNRNRSTSSSGDSNMGGTPAMMPIPTVALSLNSPNNLLTAKMGKNPVGAISNTSTALMPLTASCNSNLSNASSTSSTLTSIMHDSGICTSSSSPSVSIPSPTPHMHSPIQQVPHHHHQQQQPQPQPQQLQQQHLRPTQILPQQQQLMQSLPTPLILTTDMQQQPPQHQQQPQPQHQLQQVLLQSPQHPLQPLTTIQQPSTVIAQAATGTLCTQEMEQDLPEQTQGHLYITTPKLQLQPQLQQLPQQQLQIISPHQQQQPIPIQSSSTDVVSQEATIVASALQSLNCVQPSNLTPTMEPLPQPQIVVIPSTEVKAEAEQPPEPQPSTTSAEGQTLQTQELTPSALVAATMTTGTASVSSVCSSVNSSPQQQKSPQKNNQSHQNNFHQGRKTPAKQARTTSFSEDNDQQHTDENVVSTTPNSSSTPKEKPKLSREDRKMEAILRAIEKMERNQQRKQEQKQTKRQNSGSNNTTPTSPNKTFDSADSSGTKRSNSQSAAGPTRTKKKRKAGNRGAAHNNQRKRRQSRMNSQESIDGCGPHENDTVTSESDGCAAMLSPPIQTVASLTHSPVAMTATAPIACETMSNNVDQAAGLLMAFANPIVNPTEQLAVATAEPQSPQRPQQYLNSSHDTTASPPPTPPSHVSSACLLIEAAVGPLESNLEPNLEPSSADIINAEFKYPLQAKTKKLLMNNWLHQTEEISAGVAVEPQISPPQLSCVTGGLDSLVQAALNDFKQTQSDETEVPQNLSIVAQRVEEFIQQTEGGPPTPPPTKHSYEYEQQQQQMYATMSTPAVDLSVKHPVINAGKSTPVNRNFSSSLQVSTCSNNSSVKKRWLRQAISEETHEESQNNYSMSPSPTTPLVPAINTFVNPQVQTVPAPICSPALTTNSVPNGFTTPLKKRRLLLTDKDEEDNVAHSSGDMIPSTPLSPPPVESSIMLPSDPTAPDEYEENSTISQHPCPAPSQDVQEDVDVDVEKFEQHESSLQQPRGSGEIEQEQDVDVTSPPLEEELKTEIVTKHEPEEEIKEEDHQDPTQRAVGTPAEFNDQEDDVDILRSPSPGREMIKAEDNLVKIEPEDTSCNDDVKIDVEREESMAADDVMVPQLKREYKEEIIQPTTEELKVESVEIKQEHKTEKSESIPAVVDETVQQIGVTKAECGSDAKVESSGIKEEDEMEDELEEPKPKRLKLEENPVAEHKSVIVKDEAKPQNENVKQEKEEVAATKHEIPTSKEPMKSEKMRNAPEEVSSSTSSLARHVAKVAADTTFSSTDSATPPLPTPAQLNEECTSSVVTPPLQRNKTLSDDDIQARLHNFHKENILFLQSRNKKSKSSNSASSSSNALVASEHHRKNHKSHSSSTSSANHHHHHESKERSERSDKLSTKHHKNSSASSSSGSSKKQKLHKRERTTSSSSSSNSHKNSTSHISSSTSTITKNAVINSSTNSLSSTSSSSSSSSKKLKSLKKSSSGSSTSSSNSASSASASASSSALQNSHPSSSDNKDKHQRQRTISGSSTHVNASTSSSAAPQTPFATTKKRQLNFELELTKDSHLVNSVVTNSGKHKRLEESQGHVSVKKSRKDSASTPKEEQKNGTNKPHKLSSAAHVDKSQEKEKKSAPVNSATTSSVSAKSSPTSTSCVPHSVTSNLTTVPSQTEEVKSAAIATASSMTTVTATIVREHPTLPHFNNVVLTPGKSSLSTPPLPPLPPQATVATPTALPQPLPPQPPPPPLPSSQNIPIHVSNPSCVLPQNHANNQAQPPLPATPPPGLPGSGITSPLTTPSVNSSNNLPFFNTIYGKLLDNPTPSLTSPVAAPPLVPSISAATTPAVASTGVLSEYLDTKLKSYNTLGGYVSHTALFGLNNTPTKDAITIAAKDATIEMPAPPAPPAASAATVTTASSLSLTLNLNQSTSPNVSAMKIHTKTASHDPRLNPHLTAPEPPPQPKRKLSINEYRKRMQQTSSNESASNSLVSTPTTPPTPMETASATVSVGIGIGTAVVINKCTLNSPERLTQSVDSQIQKEIIASSSLNVYDSLNSSNSSSTSNSSLLNDSLLKSSSLVEEDSTKGQFNAAPTLLEKQQESLCARLKSLKEKQGLVLGVGGGSGSRSRFSSFSESVGSTGEYSLRKDDDDLDLLGKRNLSISSSIGAGDLLDNCLEEISSTSTSMSSSREPSPERYITTTSHHHHHGKHVLTASATTTMSTTSSSSGNSNSGGQAKQQQQQQHHHHHHHHNNGDKNTLSSSNLERKKSVDIA